MYICRYLHLREIGEGLYFHCILSLCVCACVRCMHVNRQSLGPSVIVKDVEVSAFSECFLFSLKNLLFRYQATGNTSKYIDWVVNVFVFSNIGIIIISLYDHSLNLEYITICILRFKTIIIIYMYWMDWKFNLGMLPGKKCVYLCQSLNLFRFFGPGFAISRPRKQRSLHLWSRTRP